MQIQNTERLESTVSSAAMTKREAARHFAIVALCSTARVAAVEELVHRHLGIRKVEESIMGMPHHAPDIQRLCFELDADASEHAGLSELSRRLTACRGVRYVTCVARPVSSIKQSANDSLA